MRLFKRFIQDQSGATAIEYGLIAALIFLVIVAALTSMMNGTGSMYGRVGSRIGDALN